MTPTDHPVMANGGGGGRGKRGTIALVILAVLTGVFLSAASVWRFGRFLAGYGGSPPPSDYRLYHRIIVNWTLASCYLHLSSIVGYVILKIGNVCGLPNCYFKFIKTVLLSCILNGIITLWQTVPEICLWHLDEYIHFYLHCLLWIMIFMIMIAIDITEISGLKSIFYYHLTNGNRCSFKSQQFDRFLSNMGFPGSSCLIIILWAQKVMSFDRFVLAVIWTVGLISCNKTDDKDIKYVARQIEKKRTWMYYSEEIAVSPLK